MVSSMKVEEINKDRLALASMLTGNPSNIGFSAAEPCITLVEDAKIVLKATLRQDKDLYDERLTIATDRPNFQNAEWKTDYHRSFMEKNLDSLLLAWCDPSRLIIPTSYSQDVWTTIMLHEDWDSGSEPNREKRLNTNSREVCLRLPNVNDDDIDEEFISVGSLEFPFSIMMIRETVMSYWQAFFEDSSQFYQHCGSCKKNVNEEMSFADRWSISFDSKCRYCDTMEVDLSAAIPKW